jgi:hypothetical protein
MSQESPDNSDSARETICCEVLVGTGGWKVKGGGAIVQLADFCQYQRNQQIFDKTSHEDTPNNPGKA